VAIYRVDYHVVMINIGDVIGEQDLLDVHRFVVLEAGSQ